MFATATVMYGFYVGFLLCGVFLAFWKVRHNSRIESSLGCTKGAVRVVLCTKKPHFVIRKKRMEISVLACEFRLIKVHFSDLISIINEVYVWVNKILNPTCIYIY